REARPPSSRLHAAAPRGAPAALRTGAPPDVLAVLLGGRGHRDQPGHRAARQEGLGEGDGGDGSGRGPLRQDVPRPCRDLPGGVGGLATGRARPRLRLHADRVLPEARLMAAADDAFLTHGRVDGPPEGAYAAISDACQVFAGSEPTSV